jgi:hypothetical protein
MLANALQSNVISGLAGPTRPIEPARRRYTVVKMPIPVAAWSNHSKMNHDDLDVGLVFVIFPGCSFEIYGIPSDLTDFPV